MVAQEVGETSSKLVLIKTHSGIFPVDPVGGPGGGGTSSDLVLIETHSGIFRLILLVAQEVGELTMN